MEIQVPLSPGLGGKAATAAMSADVPSSQGPSGSGCVGMLAVRRIYIGIDAPDWIGFTVTFRSSKSRENLRWKVGSAAFFIKYSGQPAFQDAT